MFEGTALAGASGRMAAAGPSKLLSVSWAYSGETRARTPDSEIDHLVRLGIGGTDDDRHLWPEPRQSIEPQWNAETKDRLEWKLRDLICSGQLDVSAAERAIAEDWVEAYGRFFPTSYFFPPAAGAATPR